MHRIQSEGSQSFGLATAAAAPIGPVEPPVARLAAAAVSADEAAAKMKRLDELIKAAGRKRSEIYMALSPYTKPITRDDLKRYRDAGVDELGFIEFNPPTSERDMIAKMEQMAREWVEPAAKI